MVMKMKPKAKATSREVEDLERKKFKSAMMKLS